MQKILRLLIGIFFITNSTVSTSTVVNFYSSSDTNYLNSYSFKDIYEVKTEIEKPAELDRSGITSLQVIYKKLTRKNLSQVEITKILDISIIEGTNSYHFIKFFNKYRLIMNMDYLVKYLLKDFGKNDSELFTFQNYIKDSIINGAPVLLTYVSDINTGHPIIIDGIEIDEINPKNTSYWIVNPELGNSYKVESSIIKEWFKYNPGTIYIGKKIDKDNKITSSVNFSFIKEGGITSDISSETKTIQLFKWSNYANTWNEFKEVYKYFEFKDFIASAGGQGQTKKTTKFQQNTNDIPNEGKKYNDFIPLVTYEYCQSPWCFATSQKAELFINSFFIKENYLYIDVQSYWQSFFCIKHVWTKLEIKSIEFYR